MDKLLIFHHIPKTAGTSLRNIIENNYLPHEIVTTYGANRKSVDWYKKFYNSLTIEEKASIRCIAAHTVHFIIPVLIEQQHPFQVFCLLRDPVDRIVSLYHFCKKIPYTKSGGGAQKGQKIRELNWKIEDIYLNLGEGNENSSELHSIFKDFFNGQTRILLSPHVNTETLEYTRISQNFYEKQVKDILQKHYVVGVQEKFSESINLFAQKFGWKNLPNRRDNIGHYENKLSKDVIELIRSYNAIDTKLHTDYFKAIQ